MKIPWTHSRAGSDMRFNKSTSRKKRMARREYRRWLKIEIDRSVEVEYNNSRG